MKLLLAYKRFVLLILLLISLHFNLQAQTNISIPCIGLPGSFQSGMVQSNGTKQEGTISSLTNSGNRGWVMFDLSSLPTGVNITSASIQFTTTSNGASSNVINYISGFGWTNFYQPSIVSGNLFYNLLQASSTNNFNGSTWALNATQTKSLNNAGIDLISQNIGGKVIFSFVRGNNNNIEILGYNTSNTSLVPKLILTYNAAPACVSMPNSGTISGVSSVCSGNPFTLTLNNYSTVSGLNFQWEISDIGSNNWVPINGATIASYTSQGITQSKSYRAIVTCVGSNSTAITSAFDVNLTSFLACYCFSSANATSDEDIFKVSFDNWQNVSDCSSIASVGSLQNRYSNYKNNAPFITIQGNTINFQVEIGTCGGNFNNASKAFIDFNHDGILNEVNEQVYQSPNSFVGPHVETGIINVPLFADTGLTVLRVVNVETGNVNAISACGNYNWGETEDYLIQINQAPICLGMPNTGIINGPTQVCANVPFTIENTGYSLSSGLVFNWESRFDSNSNWQPILGAHSTNLILQSGINNSMEFRLKVVCSNSNDTNYSNIHLVDLKPMYVCYCGPATGVNLTQLPISSINQVSIQGTSLNQYINNSSGYQLNFPTQVNSTTTLTQGTQYQLIVNQIQQNGFVGAWIDFNGNGLYETTEWLNFNQNNLQHSAIFLVPSTAYVGQVGMRIRFNNSTINSTESCTSNLGNQVIDYVLNINEAQWCQGVPNLAIVSIPDSVCMNAPISLVATNVSNGLGVYFQWEASPAGMNTWSAIQGATNPYFTFQDGIIEATDFRFKTVCDITDSFSISAIKTVQINPHFLCYCVSRATSIDDEEIFQVSVGTSTNNSNCSSVISGQGSIKNKYSNYKNLTPINLNKGVTIPFSISVGTCGVNLYDNIAAIYIDYNQNGSFLDAGENVYVSSYSSANSITSPRVLTGNFQIPNTAETGITGMRIVAVENPVVEPCGEYTWGETEDYLVNISAGTLCSGTPNTPLISVPISVCSTSSFTLNASGTALGSGVQFQWQLRPNGSSSWSDISGATDIIYSMNSGISIATFFRLKSTCINSNLSSFSNEQIVQLAPINLCYCQTINSSSALNLFITKVQFAGINAQSVSGNPNGYNDYTSIVTAGQVMLNSTNAISVQLNNFLTASAAVWIDWNQNGQFEVGEFTSLGNNNTSNVFMSSINVPSNATLGATRMRVRAKSSGVFAPTDACSQINDGETEDYSIQIVPNQNCSSVSLNVTISGPQQICPNSSFEILPITYVSAQGIDYQWQFKNGSSWQNILNATSLFPIISGITSTTQYRLLSTCSLNNLTSLSNEITISPSNSFSLFATDSIIGCGSQATMTAISGFSNYIWDDGQIGRNVVASTSGWHYCTAISGSCLVTDSLYVSLLPLPSINAGQDVFVCPGNSVVLNGSGGINLTWSGGVQNGIPFIPITNSQYVVTGMDNNGCTNTDTVLIFMAPIPNASAGNNRSICIGGSTTLFASGGSSYVWNTGDTTSILTVSNPGNYYVIATNSYGCVDTSNPVVVSVKSLPSVLKVKNATNNIVCEPNKVLMVVDLPFGSTTGFNYQWLQNGTPISGATDSVFLASSSGAYSLIVSGGQFCFKNAAPKPVTVKPLPNATFSATGPTTICAGSSVTLTAPSISGYTYSWLKDGVSAGSGNSKVFKSQGLYSVIAKLNGCLDTTDFPIQIVVNPLPVASITSITPYTFCMGDSCQLLATPNGIGFQYDWRMGTNLVATTVLPSLFAKLQGTFKVMIKDNNGCQSKVSTSSVKTKINPIPIPIISSNTSIIPLNGNVKLNASPTSGVTWQWYKDGILIPGATTKQFIATVAGNYTVAISKLGCTGISSNYSLTQSNFKEEQTQITTTNSELILKAYPNPTKGLLNLSIEALDFQEATIQIMNQIGSLVYQSYMKSNYLQLNLDALSNGVYFVRFSNASGLSGVLRIVKE